MICADGFTEIMPGSIPTGRVLLVEGTPMDFRTARRIGDRIDEDFPQLVLGQGYDHNWALNTAFGQVEKIAQVEDEEAGRTMEVWSDLPGVQFYTGTVSRRRSEKAAHITIGAVLCAWRLSIFRTVFIIRNFVSRYSRRDSRIIP